MKDIDKELIEIYKQSITTGIDTLKNSAAVYAVLATVLIGLAWDQSIEEINNTPIFIFGIFISAFFLIMMTGVAYGVVNSVSCLREFVLNLNKKENQLFENFINKWINILTVTSVLFIIVLIIFILMFFYISYS